MNNLTYNLKQINDTWNRLSCWENYSISLSDSNNSIKIPKDFIPYYKTYVSKAYDHFQNIDNEEGLLQRIHKTIFENNGTNDIFLATKEKVDIKWVQEKLLIVMCKLYDNSIIEESNESIDSENKIDINITTNNNTTEIDNNETKPSNLDPDFIETLNNIWKNAPNYSNKLIKKTTYKTLIITSTSNTSSNISEIQIGSVTLNLSQDEIEEYSNYLDTISKDNLYVTMLGDKYKTAKYILEKISSYSNNQTNNKETPKITRKFSRTRKNSFLKKMNLEEVEGILKSVKDVITSEVSEPTNVTTRPRDRKYNPN